eukprot:366599_1
MSETEMSNSEFQEQNVNIQQPTVFVEQKNNHFWLTLNCEEVSEGNKYLKEKKHFNYDPLSMKYSQINCILTASCMLQMFRTSVNQYNRNSIGSPVLLVPDIQLHTEHYQVIIFDENDNQIEYALWMFDEETKFVKEIYDNQTNIGLQLKNKDFQRVYRNNEEKMKLEKKLEEYKGATQNDPNQYNMKYLIDSCDPFQEVQNLKEITTRKQVLEYIDKAIKKCHWIYDDNDEIKWLINIIYDVNLNGTHLVVGKGRGDKLYGLKTVTFYDLQKSVPRSEMESPVCAFNLIDLIDDTYLDKGVAATRFYCLNTHILFDNWLLCSKKCEQDYMSKSACNLLLLKNYCDEMEREYNAHNLYQSFATSNGFNNFVTNFVNSEDMFKTPMMNNLKQTVNMSKDMENTMKIEMYSNVLHKFNSRKKQSAYGVWHNYTQKYAVIKQTELRELLKSDTKDALLHDMFDHEVTNEVSTLIEIVSPTMVYVSNVCGINVTSIQGWKHDSTLAKELDLVVPVQSSNYPLACGFPLPNINRVGNYYSYFLSIFKLTGKTLNDAIQDEYMCLTHRDKVNKNSASLELWHNLFLTMVKKNKIEYVGFEKLKPICDRIIKLHENRVIANQLEILHIGDDNENKSMDIDENTGDDNENKTMDIDENTGDNNIEEKKTEEKKTDDNTDEKKEVKENYNFSKCSDKSYDKRKNEFFSLGSAVVGMIEDGDISEQLLYDLLYYQRSLIDFYDTGTIDTELLTQLLPKFNEHFSRIQTEHQADYKIVTYNENKLENFEDFLQSALGQGGKNKKGGSGSMLYWTLQNVIIHIGVLIVCPEFASYYRDFPTFAEEDRRKHILNRLQLPCKSDELLDLVEGTTEYKHVKYIATTRWKLMRYCFCQVQYSAKLSAQNLILLGLSFWKYNQDKLIAFYPSSTSCKMIAAWFDHLKWQEEKDPYVVFKDDPQVASIIGSLTLEKTTGFSIDVVHISDDEEKEENTDSDHNAGNNLNISLDVIILDSITKYFENDNTTFKVNANVIVTMCENTISIDDIRQTLNDLYLQENFDYIWMESTSEIIKFTFPISNDVI